MHVNGATTSATSATPLPRDQVASPRRHPLPANHADRVHGIDIGILGDRCAARVCELGGWVYASSPTRARLCADGGPAASGCRQVGERWGVAPRPGSFGLRFIIAPAGCLCNANGQWRHQ